MKKRVILIGMIVMILLSSQAVAAGKKESRGSSKSSGGGIGQFGIGIRGGHPTGLDLKLWQGGSTAFDFALGWGMYDNDNSSVYLQGDYLLHNFASISPGKIGVHYGIGLGIGASGKSLGMDFRIPLGIDYIFPGNRVDVFLEVAPSLQLIPDSRAHAALSLGARFYP